MAAGALALACALAPESVADGNTFSWTKNGNTAITYWRSFKDDAAYMTVTARAHQKVGNRKMYVTIDFYSLRCASGQNTCASVGAGGVVTLTEGAEWHSVGHNRMPDMPKRRDKYVNASQALDPDSTLMQARVYLCYDRSITPDPCSKPRYGTLEYNKG